MGNEIAEKRDSVPAQESVQPQGAGALLSIINRMATMPELDIDRVERMFTMHQQMLDRQAEQQYNEAMAQAQRDIQSVVVNKKNDHTKSGYADIDAIHKEAKPIWTGYGLSVVTRSGRSDQQNHIRVYTEVRHSGGHKECFEDDWPLDVAGSQGKTNKTPIQGKGSTITYARRYTELMIFDIAIEDDKDGNAPKAKAEPCVSPADIKRIRDALKMADYAEADFCRSAGVDRIENLYASRVTGAISHIQGKANADS